MVALGQSLGRVPCTVQTDNHTDNLSKYVASATVGELLPFLQSLTSVMLKYRQVTIVSLTSLPGMNPKLKVVYICCAHLAATILGAAYTYKDAKVIYCRCWRVPMYHQCVSQPIDSNFGFPFNHCYAFLVSARITI